MYLKGTGYAGTISKLVEKSVPRAIIGVAVPILAGTFAMTMYQLTNAWFVSRLGTEALAAISFTFPVVMFIMLLVRGLGSGAIPLVAHAIGEGDYKKAAYSQPIRSSLLSLLQP